MTVGVREKRGSDRPEYGRQYDHPPHAGFNGEASQNGAKGSQVIVHIQRLHF